MDELGIPLKDVLAGTGLEPGDLVSDRFFELSTILKVLDNAVALSGREDLGLLLGARHTIAVLGPLSRVVNAAPTLGEALDVAGDRILHVVDLKHLGIAEGMGAHRLHLHSPCRVTTLYSC